MRKVLMIGSYVLGTLIVVGGTIILVAIGRGYSYDFKASRLVKNGLIIINSTPKDAVVSLNGHKIGHPTPYRATVEAGQYVVSLTKTGYRPWTKTVTVLASEITTIQYPVMVPEAPKLETLITGTGITQLTPSHDRRRVAYVAAGSEPGIWAADAGSNQAVKLYAAKPDEQISDLAWSDDGSHLLWRSAAAGQVTFLVQAASAGGELTNLTQLFKFDFASLRFNPVNWRELYWLGPDGLRRLDLSNQTVSAVLADKVSGYTFAGDRVVYITATPLGKSVWSLDRSGHKQELVQSVADSASYQISFSRWANRDYLAVLPSDSATVTLYADVFGATPLAKVLAKSVNQMQFSPDGHFLAFGSATTLGSYDLEKMELASWGAPPAASIISWYDDWHVLVSAGGGIWLAEFDGGNQTNLPVSGSYSEPAAVSDGRLILADTSAGTASAIVSIEIKK